jgi:hypothetical protein
MGAVVVDEAKISIGVTKGNHVLAQQPKTDGNAVRLWKLRGKHRG